MKNRTIGVVQALNKNGDLPFSEDDAMALMKLAMFVSDSFNRHRWHALERGASHGDSEASSLISHRTGRLSSRKDTPERGGKTRASQAFFGRPSDCSTAVMQALEKLRLAESTFRTLRFNSLEFAGDDLVQLVPMMMEATGCVDGCAIPLNCLNAWAKAAQGLYRDNPFHNWFHAFGCFQMCYYQIYASDIASKFRFLDVFALLAAALCHDLDHPGVTNSYLVQTESELALRYNDNSVLENHHASLACELMHGERTKINDGLDEASRRTFRKQVIRCILDTDMMLHGELCKQIVALSSAAQDERTQDNIDDKSRQLLLSFCIHTSDLSGQVMPWLVAMQWEDRVAQEFVNQAKAEAAAGYTPAPFMQFDLDDVKKRGKLQRDFVDFVCVPLWMPYTELIPQLRPCYEHLVANRKSWNNRMEHGLDAVESEVACADESRPVKLSPRPSPRGKTA